MDRVRRREAPQMLVLSPEIIILRLLIVEQAGAGCNDCRSFFFQFPDNCLIIYAFIQSSLFFSFRLVFFAFIINIWKGKEGGKGKGKGGGGEGREGKAGKGRKRFCAFSLRDR